MKASEAIAAAGYEDSKAFPVERQLEWLLRLDKFIEQSVLARFGLSAKAENADETDDRGLILPEPFTEAYVHWIRGKVAYYSEKIDRYNLEMAAFRSLLEEYQRKLRGHRLNGELEPCPFCGGPAQIYTAWYSTWLTTKNPEKIPADAKVKQPTGIGYRGNYYRYKPLEYIPRCMDVGCPGRCVKRYRTEAEAIENWNRRPEAIL